MRLQLHNLKFSAGPKPQLLQAPQGQWKLAPPAIEASLPVTSPEMMVDKEKGIISPCNVGA